VSRQHSAPEFKLVFIMVTKVLEGITQAVRFFRTLSPNCPFYDYAGTEGG